MARVLVTGATAGFGEAIARAFVARGDDVWGTGRRKERLDALAQELGDRFRPLPFDLLEPEAARRAVADLEVDVLVSNAAFQMSHDTLEEIEDAEWDFTWATNVSAYFHLVKAALPHLKEGASIIASSSVNSDMPSPQLLPYAATKAAIANMTASLAQLLADRGIRANSVAPGPVWTPLIPSTMPEDKVESFGEQVPLGRPGQPAELAPVYVLLASDEASYVSGARVAVTGGKPIL